MKYLGRIDDPKDLVTKEYVDGSITHQINYPHGSEGFTATGDSGITEGPNDAYFAVGIYGTDSNGDPEDDIDLMNQIRFSTLEGATWTAYNTPINIEAYAGFNYNGNEVATLADVHDTSFYTTSTTAAATAAKTTATVSGYKLRTGNIISVYFSYANTVEDALTLKIGATDAKAIWHNNATTSSSNPLLWSAGDIVTFVYSGSVYRVISINTFAANKDFFIATYNSTTFAKIYSEYNKGKHILCVAGDTLFTLQRITSTQAKFVCVDMASNYQIITYTVSSSGWSVTNQYPVLSVNGISPTITSYGAVSVPVEYANSTNSTSKLFLVGATTQAAEPNTYSNSNVYATNGALNAKSFSVDASANIIYNSSTKSIDFTFN